MRKNSTVVKNGNKIFKQPALTIGLDLGDRSSCYCILDESGNVVLGSEDYFRGADNPPQSLEMLLTHQRWNRYHRVIS
jgi:hypothetical protein